MTREQIWLNLGGLLVLSAMLGLFYWMSTGVRAVPAMTAALKDPNAKIRIAAAQMLAEIGPAAKPAVSNLLEQALHDPPEHAGTTAAGALPKIDLQAARQVMSAYLPALRDPDVQTRRKACVMLGSLGPVAKPAVPHLIEALDDQDELIRMRAVGALGEIGIPAMLVIPALTKALGDPARTVRHQAVSQFAFSIPPTETTLSRLKELTEDKDPGAASLAKSAVNSPHRRAKDKTSVHIMMLQMGNANDYTLRQLAQLGPEAAAAVPATIPVLKHERPLYRYLAVEVLGAIGPGARDAVPALTASLQDEDAVVRESAAEALRTINAGGAPSSGTDRK
jgi:HEAT repeat protein